MTTPRQAVTARATVPGRRIAAAVAASTLAGLVAAAVPAVAAPPTSGGAEARFAAAGADLVSITLRDGKLDLRARDAAAGGQPGDLVDPARTVFGPDGGTAVRVPDHPAFEFLGAPGRPMWALTAGDTEFASLDTTGVRRAEVRAGAVELSLGTVDGPGDFVAYTLAGLGVPTPLFGTVAGSPRRAALPASTRTGVLVWLFGAAGDYSVPLTATATLADGTRASSDTVYRVRVPEFATPVDTGLPTPVPQPAPLRQPERPAPAARQAAGPSPTLPAAQPLLAAPAGKSTDESTEKLNAATSAGRVVIDDGHVDMGPQLDGSDWTIRLKDDRVTPAVWRNLADVVLHVKDNAKTTVPDSADFLGSPGDPVWLLAQAQQSGIVWPGWNTQHPSVISGVRGPVRWTFAGVEGPGRFTLFLTGSFGAAEVLFDSTKAAPQRLDIPANTHAHGNWAFSAPGLYRLSFEMSATTTAGTEVTDTRTVTFAVGEATDPNTGFGPGSGSGDDGSGSGDNGKLPRTGSSWRVPALGVGFVLVGALVLVLVRARRPDRQLRS
ncbi:TIGR03773 family transporter-associated surface protein [Micromonospora sp. LOL_024]|uniref:TIGR03773 family transporter-associated surface protein n=1 Tax=Micromonospora sp. LOL_024 TaxID=3345412 RepID=UPI003A88910F